MLQKQVSQYRSTILDLPWITKENFTKPYNGAKKNSEDLDAVCQEQQEAVGWWTIKMNLAANQNYPMHIYTLSKRTKEKAAEELRNGKGHG